MPRLSKELDPAYTPKSEYNCDNSTTHYQGCKCHEARHRAEIDALRAENAKLRDLANRGMPFALHTSACDNHDGSKFQLLAEELVR